MATCAIKAPLIKNHVIRKWRIPESMKADKSELRISAPQSMPCMGLSICPGKVDPFAGSGPCSRNLMEDLEIIRLWGAVKVVTLMEKWELEHLRVPNLGESVKAAGMEWIFLPIIDGSALRIKKQTMLDPWVKICGELLTNLRRNEKVFIHCRGGLGRTGTLAARLPIEKHLELKEAIREVREARPGAIETIEQERYLLERQWL